MSSNNLVKDQSLPKSVWILFVASVTTLLGLALISPVLPTISQQLSASPSEVTLLYTSYNALMAVSMLITGAVSTRLGLKKTLILGIVIIGVFATLAGFSNNIWTIVGLRGLWGIGNALFFATSFTAIITLAGRSASRAIVLFEAAVGIGISAGPLLGGILGQFSWRYPFIGVGILMVVVLALLIMFLPNMKEQKRENIEKTSTSLLDPFRAMKHRSIASLGFASCLYNFGFLTILAYAPFVMGLSSLGLGCVFLGWGVSLALTSYFMVPKLQEKFGTIKSTYFMLALFTVILLIMGIWTSLTWIMAVCTIISGALIGNLNSLFSNAIVDASPVERSTTSSSYSFLRFASSAIAPFAAGVLGTIFSQHVPFLVGGCLVLGAILIIVLNRHYVQPVVKSEEIVKEKPKATILEVKDFMIPDVVSIKLDATIYELLKLLTEHHIGGVPVVDNQNKLIGMVTDGDIIRYLSPKEEHVHDFIYTILIEDEETEQEVLREKMSTTVDELMHKQHIYAIKEEDAFEKAIQILSKHNFKKIPVLDIEGKVTGIISRGDIDKSLMEILTQK